jgi:adenylosuccinate lyase
MIHPIDYRYKVEELEDFISPVALLRYQLQVELAYIAALSNAGVCSKKILSEYQKAAPKVTLKRVLELEATLKHDVRSMVEAFKEQVSSDASLYCHLGLTSYDVIVNATALVIRDVTGNLLLPKLKRLILTLINRARETKATVQMGRTHGQHAEPITFGFLLSNYIERLGRGFVNIKIAQSKFRGKIAGAVGTKAGIMLLGDAERIEAETLDDLSLSRTEAPSQITNQEELANFYSQLLIVLGTIADMANDFRQLQRTEISEVFEHTSEKQVGSSTMPQKRNPIGWENIISHYKTMSPRLVTAYMNIISEHQRDLSDSAANRYLLAEFLNSFLYCVKRCTTLVENLRVDSERMLSNLKLNDGFELAEPAYIVLSLDGLEDAHALVQEMVHEALEKGKPFREILQLNKSFREKLESMSASQKGVFEDSSKYIGHAIEITDTVCNQWEKVLKGE